MINRIVTIIFLILIISNCTKEEVGSGNLVEEIRNVPQFTGIELNGIVNTKIQYGPEQLVSIKVDDNFAQNLITEVRSNILFIDFESKANNFKNATIEVVITVKDIEVITNRSLNKVEAKGLKEVSQLTILQDGIGDIQLTGSVVQLHLSIMGVGEVQAFGLQTSKCDVIQDGIGDLSITVKDTLRGSLSGVGNINYKGQPEIELDITGVGKLINSN